MSRSHKKPIIVCTKQIDKSIDHRKVRRRVRAELSKPDPNENVLQADTRELGLQEHGTKLGFDYLSTDPEEMEKARRFSRK